jgi:dihydropteroate synthase
MLMPFERKTVMFIGNRLFHTENQTYIMGILNVTPDSFSDGGKWNQRDLALKHVEEMIAEGADIIDIGGESTRPGYTMLSDEEEMERVLPFIESVKSHFDIPISVDTYKSQVAKEAIRCGADLINDIWGLKYDSKMGEVIAQGNAACCLMHNRENGTYQNFMQELAADLSECVYLAKKAGIKEEKIILDPGIGFAKNYKQNLEAINRIKELKVIGLPILLGASRKSVIGITLDLPAEERVEGTLVTTVLAVINGCSFVRVHDIKEHKRAIDMTRAILQA